MNALSTRYGISLIPDPAFTQRVYRARQLICGQYACWAAEMHMLHLPLIQYFECQENVLSTLISLLESVSSRTVGQNETISLVSEGVSHSFDNTGEIYLDFNSLTKDSPGKSPELHRLYFGIQNELQNLEGITLNVGYNATDFAPRINLMQHAELPLAVFESAAVFASSVIEELSVPTHTKAWQLVLIRYTSNAAGEDWNQGLWANDLSWNLVGTYPI